MKILHTSDWHLGLKLNKVDLNDQMKLFLEWLIAWIEKEHIDCVIHAGDVFDSRYPSQDAIDLYHQFLSRIVQIGCKAVIVAGNHDSGNFLESPRHLLNQLGIHIVGNHKMGEEELVVIENRSGTEAIVVCAIPYIKEGALVTFTPSMSRDDLGVKIMQSMADKYRSSWDYARLKYPGKPIIATGHLFVQGTEVSDAEHPIRVGNLGGISPTLINCGFDYVALGHIHRGQSVTPDKKVRYAGSPVTLSFSEFQDVKHIVLLETNDSSMQATKIEVPKFRSFLRWQGNAGELISRLQTHRSQGSLPDMIEITLKEEKNIGTEAVMLNDFLINDQQDKHYIVSKRILERSINTNEQTQTEIIEEITDLQPAFIFEKIMHFNNYDEQQAQLLLDAFNKIEKTIHEN